MQEYKVRCPVECNEVHQIDFYTEASDEHRALEQVRKLMEKLEIRQNGSAVAAFSDASYVALAGDITVEATENYLSDE